MTESIATSSARRPRAGLGRGLSALMGDIAQEAPIDAQGGSLSGVRMMAVSAIAPHPDQPRRRFDEAALDELAASIAVRGLIQPIVVRPHGTTYQIVAGERRWRAAQRARLHEVPVVVRELDESETLEIALLENIQREDLNAIEEAQAYARLVREFGHTQEVLARIVHKSRSHIANLLRLLDLPGGVQALVIDGRLTMGHARALIGAVDPEALAAEVVARSLSVRETEKLAQAAKPATASSERRGPDPDLIALERQLAEMLGLAVKISHGPRGGMVALAYSTLDQLDMICQRLSDRPL